MEGGTDGGTDEAPPASAQIGGTAEQRLSRLIREHQPKLTAYARRRLADWQAAEDLTAATFVVAWQRIDDVPAQPLPWLYAVARRLLLNEYRKSSRRERAERSLGEQPTSTVDPAVRVVENDHVVRALAALRETDRELLMLIGWEGLTVAEAATVLGATAPVVSLRLHRARKRLTKRLAEADAESAIPLPNPVPSPMRSTS